jgi:hypothetical protein
MLALNVALAAGALLWLVQAGWQMDFGGGEKVSMTY